MAVKAAVVGYEEVTKAPEPASEAEVEEEIEDKELDELDRKDLEGLLLADAGDELELDGGEGGGICECEMLG